MDEASTESLQEAILSLHGCQADWVESVTVNETFRGQPVWQGEVQVFRLRNHPAAQICYAWSEPITDSPKRKVLAVLHQGPVDSAAKAVRAAIVESSKR
jgi:hypothetical protein